MDSTLSEFITRTSADPGFARDLLEAHKWELKGAINAFYDMKGIGFSSNNHEVFENEGILTGQLNGYSDLSSLKALVQINNANIAANIITNNSKCNSEPSLSSPSPPTSPESSTTSSPSKLAISKLDVNDADLIDEIYPKKLARGISRATDNELLVSKARTEFAHDFRMSSRGSRLMNETCLVETTEYTFTLPDLSIHQPDFSQFLEKDLIEKSSLVSLENAGRLNWWADIGACQKLWPLATTGDGNCLLHAASLGMYGFSDRLLTLRKALHSVLVNSSFKNAFYRRWRWQSNLQNSEAGLILCEEEWEREWQSLLKMASTEPRVRAHVESNTVLKKEKKNSLPEDDMQPHVYESLEEIHILTLAHVLKRPIIVIADTMLKDVTGEPFAPIPFGGIYLPLECPTADCHLSPLCLTYDAAHFSALVAMDMETYADKTPHPPAVIPLTDSNKKLLPLQFAVDPGQDVCWTKDVALDKKILLTDKKKLELLRSYLDVTYINLAPSESSDSITTTPKGGDGIRNQLEKSHTLPSNFEYGDGASSSDSGTTNSMASGTLTKRLSLSKLRMPKQLQSLGRHFGSLGRSFRKKIRKNLGHLTRGTSFRRPNSSKANHSKDSLGVKNGNISDLGNVLTEAALSAESDDHPLYSKNILICAALRTEKRHDYQEEMIRNYLSTARVRFLDQQKDKREATNYTSSKSSSSSSTSTPANEKSTDNYAAHCVNTGCSNFGTAATNYLCSSCFLTQKEEMEKSSLELLKDEKSSNQSLLLRRDEINVNRLSCSSFDEKVSFGNKTKLSADEGVHVSEPVLV